MKTAVPPASSTPPTPPKRRLPNGSSIGKLDTTDWKELINIVRSTKLATGTSKVPPTEADIATAVANMYPEDSDKLNKALRLFQVLRSEAKQYAPFAAYRDNPDVIEKLAIQHAKHPFRILPIEVLESQIQGFLLTLEKDPDQQQVTLGLVADPNRRGTGVLRFSPHGTEPRGLDSDFQAKLRLDSPNGLNPSPSGALPASSPDFFAADGESPPRPASPVEGAPPKQSPSPL